MRRCPPDGAGGTGGGPRGLPAHGRRRARHRLGRQRQRPRRRAPLRRQRRRRALRRLEPDDHPVVDSRDGSWTGPRAPTSEIALHTGLMAARPDVGAVVHTHSRLRRRLLRGPARAPVHLQREHRDLCRAGPRHRLRAARDGRAGRAGAADAWPSSPGAGPSCSPTTASSPSGRISTPPTSSPSRSSGRPRSATSPARCSPRAPASTSSTGRCRTRSPAPTASTIARRARRADRTVG